MRWDSVQVRKGPGGSEGEEWPRPREPVSGGLCLSGALDLRASGLSLPCLHGEAPLACNPPRMAAAGPLSAPPSWDTMTQRTGKFPLFFL